jgi:hypothetical protein
MFGAAAGATYRGLEEDQGEQNQAARRTAGSMAAEKKNRNIGWAETMSNSKQV